MTFRPPTLTDEERAAFYARLGAGESPPGWRGMPLPVRFVARRDVCFDGAAAWDRLTADERAAIGALALELAVAHYGLETADGDEIDGWLTCAEAAHVALDRHALAAVDAHRILDLGRKPPFPALDGALCRECGDARRADCRPPWGEGSGWAEPDLCSPCADAQDLRTYRARRRERRA